MKLLCKILGHDDHPTDYRLWEKTGINFICRRCLLGSKEPFSKERFAVPIPFKGVKD